MTNKMREHVFRANTSRPRNHLIIIRHGTSCANKALSKAWNKLLERDMQTAVDTFFKGRFYRQPLLTRKGAEEAYGSGLWLNKMCSENYFTTIKSVESSVLPRAAMTAAFIICHLDIKESLTPNLIPPPPRDVREGKVVKIIPYFGEVMNIIDKITLSSSGTQNSTTLESLTAFLHSIHHVVKILCEVDVYFDLTRITKENISTTNHAWEYKIKEMHNAESSTVLVSHGKAMDTFMRSKVRIDCTFHNCHMILYEPCIPQPMDGRNFKILANPDSKSFDKNVDWNDLTQYVPIILSCNYNYHIHIKLFILRKQEEYNEIINYRTNLELDNATWFHDNWKTTHSQGAVNYVRDAYNYILNKANDVFFRETGILGFGEYTDSQIEELLRHTPTDDTSITNLTSDWEEVRPEPSSTSPPSPEVL